MSKRLIGILLAIVIAGVLSECSSANRNSEGVITESGDVDAFETKVGDCFSSLPDASSQNEMIEFKSLQAVPCTEPHKWQVVQKGYITQLEDYSADSIQEIANGICDNALNALINSLSLTKLNEYRDADTTNFVPTYKSWANDDRTVDCLVGSDTTTYFTSIFE